jgi:hypothetical protein
MRLVRTVAGLFLGVPIGLVIGIGVVLALPFALALYCFQEDAWPGEILEP